MAHSANKFFGCYLLVSANPKYKGWTYIGFTVNPDRRCNQHNVGRLKGGAWRTSGKGPWDMVLIIHGFPSKISALQFEWAWQHPQKSTKLKDVTAKHSRMKGFNYRFLILSEMLRVGPWNRLPLTIRWLNQEYTREFNFDLQPPTHMAITYGPVKLTAGTTNQKNKHSGVAVNCIYCEKSIKDRSQLLQCPSTDCSMISHMTCIAEDFLIQEGSQGELLPVAGDCKICSRNLLWGELIQRWKGSQIDSTNSQAVEKESGDDGDAHWGESLTQ